MSRVTRSKEEAKASYDRMSKWYDLLAGHSEREFRERGLARLDAEAGEAILDIGFGTGHSVVAIAHSVGNSGRVYGIDISEGMLDLALSRVIKAGLSERVTLMRGDALILPFEARFFDAIFISFTLELFDTPEIPEVLGECRRVLRSGGRIAVVALSKRKKVGVVERLYEWAHARFPGTVDCRPIFVQKTLEGAAFQILDLTELTMWGLPIAIALAKTP